MRLFFFLLRYVIFRESFLLLTGLKCLKSIVFHHYRMNFKLSFKILMPN